MHMLLLFVVGLALLRIPGGAPMAATESSSVSRPHEIRTVFFDRGVRPLTVGASTRQTRSWVVLSVPTDDRGPFPLAIILHGAHTFCSSGRARDWPCPNGSEVANHDGFSWLAEALARRGFVAIAVGINAEFAQPADKTGSVAASIIERDVLGPLSIPNTKFASWFDPTVVDRSKVILIGHSRGAAIASVLGRGEPSRSLSLPVSSAILLAPTADTVNPALLADVPTAVFIGSCDGDTGVDGGQFFTASMSRVRRAPVALLLSRGATHNALNERLRPEPSDQANPDCAGSVRLDPDAQRSQVADLVPQIVGALQTFGSLSSARSILDVTRADDRIAPGLRIVHLDPTGRRRSILEPSYGWPFRGATTTGLWVVRCPAGISSPFRSPGTEACRRLELTELVGRPASTQFSWTTTGGRLRLSHPRLAAGSVLVLRAFANPLSIGSGTEVTALVTGTDPATREQPAWSKSVRFPAASIGEPITDAGLRRGAVLWSEHRIVLPSPTSVTTLTITGPSIGALDIVGIEAVITR